MLILIETIMCIASFYIGKQLSRPHSRFTMRSALTDAPVVSFTTLPLRATQHATGLMMKVALLLPSRDPLSSQRQLTWTHTCVLPIVGRDNGTSAMCKHQQRFGLDVQFSAFVVNFNLIFTVGICYGQIEYVLNFSISIWLYIFIQG
jgi:hypothetical protein